MNVTTLSRFSVAMYDRHSRVRTHFWQHFPKDDRAATTEWYCFSAVDIQEGIQRRLRWGFMRRKCLPLYRRPLPPLSELVYVAF